MDVPKSKLWLPGDAVSSGMFKMQILPPISPLPSCAQLHLDMCNQKLMQQTLDNDMVQREARRIIRSLVKKLVESMFVATPSGLYLPDIFCHQHSWAPSWLPESAVLLGTKCPELREHILARHRGDEIRDALLDADIRDATGQLVPQLITLEQDVEQRLAGLGTKWRVPVK